MFVETVEILDSYTIHYSYTAQMILDQFMDMLVYLVDELPNLKDAMFLWITEYLKGHPDRFLVPIMRSFI